MNAIVKMIDGIAVTTSLSIAEGTDNDHASVIKLVRTYQADLEEFGRVGFEIAPFETAGGTQSREIAILNEQQSTLILTYMRNSEIVRRFKKSLVREFFDLVQQAALARFNVPTTYPEAMRLAADLADQRNIAQAALAIAAPKAEALDRLATPTEGSVGLRIAAKLLQMPEKQFLQFANAKGYIFRNHMSKVWQGYSDKAKAGLVEQKITQVERDDGTTKTVEQVLITRLGLAKLALMLGIPLPANDSNMELSA